MFCLFFYMHAFPFPILTVVLLNQICVICRSFKQFMSRQLLSYFSCLSQKCHISSFYSSSLFAPKRNYRAFCLLSTHVKTLIGQNYCWLKNLFVLYHVIQPFLKLFFCLICVVWLCVCLALSFSLSLSPLFSFSFFVLFLSVTSR